MNITHPHVLKHDLDRLLAEYGLRRVLATLMAALVSARTTRGRIRRARPPDAADLPAHLRRDVGLPADLPTRAHYFDHALKSMR